MCAEENKISYKQQKILKQHYEMMLLRKELVGKGKFINSIKLLKYIRLYQKKMSIFVELLIVIKSKVRREV